MAKRKQVTMEPCERFNAAELETARKRVHEILRSLDPDYDPEDCICDGGIVIGDGIVPITTKHVKQACKELEIVAKVVANLRLAKIGNLVSMAPEVL